MARILWKVGTALAVCAALAGCKSELYSDLSEREANQVVAALMSAGIPAAKAPSRGDGVGVTVASARFAEAMEILNARGLPTNRYDSLGDVFRKEGLVSSPIEERARYIYALSQELSHTITEIDGVLSARIHVVLPDTDMLGREFKASSASVFIRHVANAPVVDFTSQIRLLVSNSIDGLVYDNVTVVAVPAAADPVATSDAPTLEGVMGVWVHPGSSLRLWAMLGGLAALSTLLAAGLGWTLFARQRRPGDEFDAA